LVNGQVADAASSRFEENRENGIADG